MAYGDYGRRMGFRNLGRLDLEERRWRQQQLARNQMARQEAELAQRMAQEEEAISLSQWQPEPEQQEVKITTKADGTSTIVSTDKFPAQSLLDDPMNLAGTTAGDWGLSVTPDQAGPLTFLDNDTSMMSGVDYGAALPGDPLGLDRPQGQWDQTPHDIAMRQDIIAREKQFTPTQEGHPLHQYWDGEKFVSTLEEEPVISPEGMPIPGVDMGGLQRFDPYIPPDEAYRQAYGDQERVMGMRGLLEEEVPPVIVPPPDVQVAGIQTQIPMVQRAIAEVDRGTNNILPPLDVPSGSNILPTMEDIPPTLPNWLTGMGEAEAPFAPAQAITPDQGPLGPPGQYSAPPWDRMGLLGDEEILAGGLPPVEGAYDPRDDFDAMAGGVPEVSDFNPFTGIEPEPSVETDILESQIQGWVDPDTGLKPAPGKIRTREEIRGEALTGLSEKDIDTEMILDPNLSRVAESVDTLYQMQKTTAMMSLFEGMKRKSKARSIRGVGRRRQGRQMQLLNPTPLQMEG